MEYKKGHKIKPRNILQDGIVVFTDGTDEIVSANQISCEAYGYTYNRESNTCHAFNNSFKIPKLFKSAASSKRGAENSIEGATMNTLINGNKNTTKGQNRNVLINGESHQVESGINNASVFGTYGKALRQAEVVIGGGEALGRNQTSIIQLAGTTTDATATDLTIQGDGSSYIAVQNNSILGFEVKVIAVVSGGGDGTAGDYKYFEIKGAVKVDNSYNTTFSQSTATIASVGTTGTVQMEDVSDPYITVEVTGTANVNIEWFASVQLTEKKLKSATF